jgi:hypothetical protein
MHSCPKEVKAAAYTTLVRPSIEYASSVWDPYTRNNIHQLEAILLLLVKWMVKHLSALNCICHFFSHISSCCRSFCNWCWSLLLLITR